MIKFNNRLNKDVIQGIFIGAISFQWGYFLGTWMMYLGHWQNCILFTALLFMIGFLMIFSRIHNSLKNEETTLRRVIRDSISIY